MNRATVFSLAASLALSILTAIPAAANEENKRTEFHFDTTVQIPGMMLSPGNYVFSLEDTSDLNVVRISTVDSKGDETTVATRVTTVDYLSESPAQPIIHFEHRDTEGPKAVYNWFYPGDNWGWKFIYSAH